MSISDKQSTNKRKEDNILSRKRSNKKESNITKIIDTNLEPESDDSVEVLMNDMDAVNIKATDALDNEHKMKSSSGDSIWYFPQHALDQWLKKKKTHIKKK